jgi:adenosylcobinamide-GDP ribazoletransferase
VTGAGAEIRAAVAALTRVPVAVPDPGRTGAAAFGLVGAGLGLAAVVPIVALGGVAPVAASIVAVAVLVAGSGALHVDGLADTADALLATDRDAAERARKDPAVGPGGVAAVGLVLALQVGSLLAVVEASAWLAAAACILAGTISRAIPVLVAATASPAATIADGWGQRFAAGVTGGAAAAAGTTVVVVGAGVVAVALAATRDERAAIGLATGGVVAVLVSLGLGRLVVRLRGRLDGDALGAGVELAVAGALLSVATASAIAGLGAGGTA